MNDHRSAAQVGIDLANRTIAYANKKAAEATVGLMEMLQAADSSATLTVPWNGGYLKIQVAEDAERPEVAAISITGSGVKYYVEPVQSSEILMVATDDA